MLLLIVYQLIFLFINSPVFVHWLPESLVQWCCLDGRVLLQKPLHHQEKGVPSCSDIQNHAVVWQTWNTNTHFDLQSTLLKMFETNIYCIYMFKIYMATLLNLPRSRCFSCRTVLAMVDLFSHTTTALSLAHHFVTDRPGGGRRDH